MAIEQVKTISELERFEELLDSYALAISSGSTTGSGTLLQMANYLKTYLQDVSKKIQTIDESADNYPSSIAVKNYVEGYSQALSSLVQNLENPSATTYPSTQAVVNESNRIISIMDNQTMRPGNNFTSVSIPETSTTVTAPANGYYSLQRYAIQPEGVIALMNLTSGMKSTVTSGNRGNPFLRCFIPVRKGDIVQVDYIQVNASADEFLFCYAG